VFDEASSSKHSFPSPCDGQFHGCAEALVLALLTRWVEELVVKGEEGRCY